LRKKTRIYKKALRCYQEGLKRRHPEIEFCEVPYEGKTLPAYFMNRRESARTDVVLFDGMDNARR